MRNPFVYGESVIGENFCDRDAEIRKLKMAILIEETMSTFLLIFYSVNG